MADATGLSPALKTALDQMIAASGGKITIVSGFRTNERQAQLFSAAEKKYGSAAKARKWVAPPGKSNHNKGLAVDLGGDLKLAHKLAARYGLSFPMGHEPWHVELAGTRSTSSPMAYTDPDPDVQKANAVEDPDLSDPITQFSNILNVIQSGVATGSAPVTVPEGVEAKQKVQV